MTRRRTLPAAATALGLPPANLHATLTAALSPLTATAALQAVALHEALPLDCPLTLPAVAAAAADALAAAAVVADAERCLYRLPGLAA